ncbi:amino acid ABC transporter permease [Roseiterribacter gracilis]|uniref:Glutamate/aspartate import permease protein GltK n=1 Tax=Roseiterribacter gracilis TaxID=2812848 RepID=A0A8S8XA81_9PROT|nr:glutamate/aspartate transporter permease GltK [Rhodospirillales bacterium TMPK1]
MSGFDWNVILNNRGLLLQGLAVSFQLTLVAIAGGMALGTVLAMCRLSRFRPLAIAAGSYVNFLRSLPLILVIFWFYILTPQIVGHPIDAYSSVLIAFTLFEAAYYCEIIRAGIASVKAGQVNAGLALGFGQFHVMRYVVLPQAFRNMLPVLLTQAIIMFQDTSIVYVVGVRDFLTAADVVANSNNRPVELYSVVAVTFLVICFTASRLVGRLQRKYAL